MIDIEEFRCRIGCFRGRSVKLDLVSLQTSGVVGFIAMLLFMAGIELNPGPLDQQVHVAMSSNKSCKKDKYLEKHVGGQRKFECLICGRIVSYRRSVLQHLSTQHNLSPVKPERMLYKHMDRPVPRSTKYRWKTTKCSQSLSSNITSQQDGCLSVIGNDILTGDALALPLPSNSNDEHLEDSFASSSSESEHFLSFESSEVSSDESSADVSCISKSKTAEKNAFQLLACLKKHKVSANGCKDILKTLRDVLPDHESNSILHYGRLLSYVPDTVYKEINYCCKCENILEGRPIFQCGTEGCSCVQKSFMISNIAELLQNLLKAPGILSDIRSNTVNQDVDSTNLTDIYSGELYKRSKRNMSPNSVHLTSVLNTDGVNLYSSSKVELWPVFLAINELSPSLRFARENLLLVGLWQGKGKPPFKLLFKFVSQEINILTESGLEIKNDGEPQTVYLTVLCITTDLPAKAGVLNMTLFNGTCACISCEEPGIVVKQGRGHSRSYPYRPPDERFPRRLHENVLQNMGTASDKDRVKGFKGLSGLTFLQQFDLVNGIVPDYMHCVLLGIVKNLMSKWFSPTECAKQYFVGKQLKQISERLMKIKPPYFIERLPREIEKHYAHFKATELQTFLLYYAIPCLHGILPDKYLQHFALLSEGIFILLGDQVSENGIERSEYLLEKFYSQFAELYGCGSCGLNVHNACFHLTDYVKKLGPIWCWSCFAFEDANAMLLQSIHGTGDVVKQALRNQEISMYIRLNNVKQCTSSKLKVTHKADNCCVVGLLKLLTGRVSLDLIQTLNVESKEQLRKAERVLVNGNKFYSKEYSRMKRRHCHAVLYSENQFGLIQYFVLVLPTNLVYAVVQEMVISDDSWVYTYEAVKHLKPVDVRNTLKATPVENLQSTLVYIDLENTTKSIVIRTPNQLGHAVLK